MEIMYYVSGWLMMLFFVLLIVGLIRPKTIRKLYFPPKKSSVSRKLVLATMLPTLIVSVIGLTAFEPESVRAERVLLEEQALQDKLELEIAAEEARLAELELERKAAGIEEARLKTERETKIKADEKERQTKERREKEQLEQKRRAEQEAAAAARIQRAAQEEALRIRPVAPKPTPAPTPAPKPRQPAPSPRPAPAPRNYVHPGSFCTPPGARGFFKSGNPAICAIDSKGLRYRWQSP